MTAGLLSASDIAADRNWDRTTAWRWLRRLEREHGAKLVRKGKTLYIERTELARVSTLMPKPIDHRVAKALQQITDRLDDIEDRQNGLAADVAEFRRKAYEWFRKR